MRNRDNTQRLARWAALAMAGGVATPAQGATIIVNHQLDPALLSDLLVQDMLAVPVSLAGGDTLDLRIHFTGGQRLSIIGDTYLWPVLVTAPGEGEAILPVSGSMTFRGAGGALASGAVPLLGSNAFAHIGLRVAGSDYRTGSGAISFTGIRQLLDIGHTTPPGARLFDRIGLVTDGLVIASPAPEPGGWALMLTGFLGVGWTLRRGRAPYRASARQRPSG